MKVQGVLSDNVFAFLSVGETLAQVQDYAFVSSFEMTVQYPLNAYIVFSHILEAVGGDFTLEYSFQRNHPEQESVDPIKVVRPQVEEPLKIVEKKIECKLKACLP